MHIYRIPREVNRNPAYHRGDTLLRHHLSINFSRNLSFRKSINIGLSETAVLDIMAANLQQQRAINEQLRREADIQRMSVSEACSLMIKYVSEHENEDCLLSGFSSQKVNPFREKSSCGVL